MIFELLARSNRLPILILNGVLFCYDAMIKHLLNPETCDSSLQAGY